MYSLDKNLSENILKKFQIFLDMDGVLVNFIKYYLDHPKYNKEKVTYETWPPGVWNFEEVLSITKKEFFKSMDDADLWEGLSRTEEYDDILFLLKPFFKLGNICLLTTSGNMANACKGKVNWINRNFSKIDFLITNGNKGVCAGNKKHILIDDSEKNIKEFILKGGSGVLVPRPTNSLYKEKNNVVFTIKKNLEKVIYSNF